MHWYEADPGCQPHSTVGLLLPRMAPGPTGRTYIATQLLWGEVGCGGVVLMGWVIRLAYTCTAVLILAYSCDLVPMCSDSNGSTDGTKPVDSACFCQNDDVGGTSAVCQAGQGTCKTDQDAGVCGTIVDLDALVCVYWGGGGAPRLHE